MNHNDNFVFSARSLQDYLDCPRRFYLRYIRNISWPAIPGDPILEIEENLHNGRQFHQLACQFLSGIPEELLNNRTKGSPLREWLSTFIDYVNTLQIGTAFVEETLVTELNGRQIQARYDLIFQDHDGSISIIDWKTTGAEPRKSFLQEKMQTIIYPFILAESLEELFPGNRFDERIINMRYWYVNYPRIIVEFTHGEKEQIENRKILSELISEIINKEPDDFSKTKDKSLCRFCTYRSLCERGSLAGVLTGHKTELDLDDLTIDFDNIGDFEFGN